MRRRKTLGIERGWVSYVIHLQQFSKECHGPKLHPITIVTDGVLIGFKISRRVFNQREEKQKAITPCMQDFSRALNNR